MRNGSYLPASIKWQNTSLSVSELAPLMRPAPKRQGPSLSLSSLLCLTVHFSARIFDLERYESRRSEGRKREKRGVALIHSTVSASLPPLSALPPGDVLPLRLRRSAKISLVSSFPTFHSWSALPDRERRRNAMLAIHFYLRRSRQVYGL